MTTAELAKMIGASVQVRTDIGPVWVIVRDAKVAYGDVRYKVTPTGPDGPDYDAAAWVSVSRVVREEQAR